MTIKTDKIELTRLYFNRTRTFLSQLASIMYILKSSLRCVSTYYICMSYFTSPLAILISFVLMNNIILAIMGKGKPSDKKLPRFLEGLSLIFDLAKMILLLLTMHLVLPVYPIWASFAITAVGLFATSVMSEFLLDLSSLIISLIPRKHSYDKNAFTLNIQTGYSLSLSVEVRSESLSSDDIQEIMNKLSEFTTLELVNKSDIEQKLNDIHPSSQHNEQRSKHAIKVDEYNSDLLQFDHDSPPNDNSRAENELTPKPKN